MKFIVVDDEEIVLSLVRDALEDAGYQIELADSGAKALERIKQEYFDFLLTDIRMPGVDGLELAKKARELIPSIGVIFMTGYANLNSAKDAIKEGAYDYIMKPFELNEMRQAVRNAVKKKQKDTEKTLANELSHLSDLNQLMYTVGDLKSLMRMSLGFVLMQAKAQKGAILFKNTGENETGFIASGDTETGGFQEVFQKHDRDFFDFDSNSLTAPFVITSVAEHPLYRACNDPQVTPFLIPPWHSPGDRLVNIALKRGPKLYGFVILGLPDDCAALKTSDSILLTITANQIAISLENIILLEDTRTAYRRLKDLQDQTIQLEKMAVKGQMSAEIGHELNNFLGVASGNLSLLERNLEQKNYRELEKYLQAVIGNLDNIKKFSKGLMDFSALAPNLELADITSVVGGVVDYLRSQKQFEGVDLEFEKPSGSVFSMVDTSQFQQLLYNLLNNAADAVQEKRDDSERKVGIRLTYDRDAEVYEIEVSDNGVGIDPALMEKAFNQRFTTKKSGHGFGLLVCRRIIENHGASLKADSVPGSGTTITVTFPVRVSIEEPALID